MFISPNYVKINFLLLENIMIFHNAIILIKSVFNIDKNNYYYNTFLEKASNELPKI